MKKTISFLVAAAFVFALGGFAQAQDQTPPPPKPVVTAAVPTSPVPPAQAVPHPAKPVSTPHKAPVAETSPSAAVPALGHPAPGLKPHPVATTPAPPAAIALMTPLVPAAPTTAEGTIPHPADIAVTPHPTAPMAAAPAMIAPTAMSVPAAPGTPVAVAIEQTLPPKEAAAPTQVAHPAGQAQTAPPTKPEKAPAVKTEIIRFQFAQRNSVYAMLVSHKSRWGVVTMTDEKTIVVTDTPEILEKMISIVKEIDVKPVEIQFTVQLVQGTEAEGSGDESLKNDSVIRELRSVLRYKSFSLLDGTLVRVIDDNDTETNFGPKGDYLIRLKPKYIKEGSTETIQTMIQFREKAEFQTTPQRTYNDLIQTTLQLKVGEKTVVGVSKNAADKGLILILSAKVIK